MEQCDEYSPETKKPNDNEDNSLVDKEKPLIRKYKYSKIVAYQSFPGRTIIKSPFESSLQIYYGIIVFLWKTRKWLIIKRKYTTDFLKFVEGSYRNSDLKTILNGLTLEELTYLKTLSQNSFKFNSMFKTIFPEKNLEELVYSKERFLSSSETIKKFVHSSSNPKNYTWQFPCLVSKNSDENPIDIALKGLKLQTGLEITQKEKSFLGRDPFSEKEFLGNLGDLVDVEKNKDYKYWLVVWMEEPKIENEGNFEFQWISSSNSKNFLNLPKRLILKQAKQMIKDNLLL